jgi:sugar lactone lactonase YvrE
VSTVAETGFLETMIWDDQGNMLAPAGSFREYIMRITPDGETSVFAGQRASAGSTDGSLENAKFSNVSGLAMDAAGNAYVTQGISLRQKAGDQLIRMITVDGEVITIAGQRFQEGYQDGPGIDVMFNFPVALAAAPDGTLFVADSVNNCIRRVGPAPDYEVTTVAGACGQPGDLVDGEGEAARFKSPQGLALTEDGVLYVADSLNNAIRVITFQ